MDTFEVKHFMLYVPDIRFKVEHRIMGSVRLKSLMLRILGIFGFPIPDAWLNVVRAPVPGLRIKAA